MTALSAPSLDPTGIEARRIGAWTIDLFLFVALVLGVLVATGGVDVASRSFESSQAALDYCNSIDTKDGRRACSPYQNEAVVVSVEGSADGVWLAYTIFYILLQGLTGASLGKLAMGLRVVDPLGQRAGISKSFVRTFLWVVDAITCGLPIVGGFLMVTKPGHQRFGDRVAGTYVVRKHAMGTPVVIPPPIPDGAYAFPLPAPGYAPPPGYPPPYGYPVPQESDESEHLLQRPSHDAPSTDGPHWDDDRDTYIQFDRAVEMWVQWDAAAQHWRPIET